MNYELLYSMLLANCPVDTRNMVTNIILSDFGDYQEININVEYAQAVNYNRQRGPKEIKNYKWVERVIKQWAEIVGGNIEYELS